MSEQYWVLRVKGRNRWQETVHTGSPGSAFQEALTLAEKYQAEVTVFEARPVRVVSIKDVSRAAELGLAQYEIMEGQPVYRPCGHRVEVEDGELIKNYCPVCSKEREEVVPRRQCECGTVDPIPKEASKGYCRGCGAFFNSLLSTTPLKD